jgi:hypothetical protein
MTDDRDRERELYDATRELRLLLLEARAGVPHQAQTIRCAIEAADTVRERSAEARGWTYAPMAEQLAEPEP